MPIRTRPLVPHRQSDTERNVRQALIQNLTSLLHICLLRNDLERASRAWAILIRCREVNWKSKWQWGLHIHLGLSRQGDEAESSAMGAADTSEAAREREKWLRTLMVRGKEEERPTLLHALILLYIQAGKYREALDELELYLPSYPYLRSAPLHTYAGLLCFYQAQPDAAKVFPSTSDQPQPSSTRQQRRHSSDSSNSDGSSTHRANEFAPPHPPPDMAGVRAARNWFMKALKLDKEDRVAQRFIEMIDGPADSDDDEPPDHASLVNNDIDQHSDISQFPATQHTTKSRTSTPSTEGIEDFSDLTVSLDGGDDYSDTMSIG